MNYRIRSTFYQNGFPHWNHVLEKQVGDDLWELVMQGNYDAGKEACQRKLEELQAEEKPEGIVPGVWVDGKLYHVPGCMYVFAFAVAGVPWAVKALEDDPSIATKVKAWEAAHEAERLKAEVARRREALEREQKVIAQLEEQQFAASLAAATAEVETWPAWKQNILRDSGSPTVRTPRTPVVHDDAY